MLKAFSDKMIVQSLTYTEYTLKAWKTLYVFVLLIAGYRKAASWQLLPGEVRVHGSAALNYIRKNLPALPSCSMPKHA